MLHLLNIKKIKTHRENLRVRNLTRSFLRILTREEKRMLFALVLALAAPVPNACLLSGGEPAEVRILR
jgi:hypothetical protein